MKMIVAGFLENFGSDYPLARCYIPEKQNSQLHHCENLSTWFHLLPYGTHPP